MGKALRNKTNLKVATVGFSPSQLEEMDRLVSEGKFSSRSSLVREAVSIFLTIPYINGKTMENEKEKLWKILNEETAKMMEVNSQYLFAVVN